MSYETKCQQTAEPVLKLETRFKAKCQDSSKEYKLNAKYENLTVNDVNTNDLLTLKLTNDKRDLKITRVAYLDLIEKNGKIKVVFDGTETALVSYQEKDKSVHTLKMNCSILWGNARYITDWNFYNGDLNYPVASLGDLLLF